MFGVKHSYLGNSFVLLLTEVEKKLGIIGLNILPEASTACNELLYYSLKGHAKAYVNVLGQNVVLFAPVQGAAADKYYELIAYYN